MITDEKYKWIATFGVDYANRSRPGETLSMKSIPTTNDMKFWIENLDDPSCIYIKNINLHKEINDMVPYTEKIGDKLKFKGFSIITSELKFTDDLVTTTILEQ